MRMMKLKLWSDEPDGFDEFNEDYIGTAFVSYTPSMQPIVCPWYYNKEQSYYQEYLMHDILLVSMWCWPIPPISPRAYALSEFYNSHLNLVWMLAQPSIADIWEIFDIPAGQLIITRLNAKSWVFTIAPSENDVTGRYKHSRVPTLSPTVQDLPCAAPGCIARWQRFLPS